MDPKFPHHTVVRLAAHSPNRGKTKRDSLIVGALLVQVQPCDENRSVPTSKSAFL